MQGFVIHTIESAPPEAKDTLRQVQRTLGFVPNLAAGMAEAPSLLHGFFAVREIYSQGTLSAAEIQALSLVNARENDCDWCMAFHSLAAEKAGLPQKTIAALRDGVAPTDPRLRSLCALSRELVAKRGKVDPATLSAFYAAGLGPAQALEVVLGVGFSVVANYAHHLIGAPLDERLEPFAWVSPSLSGAPQPATAPARAPELLPHPSQP